MKEQEYIERYIYDVVRRLPKNQRQEANMELRELINDMMEDMGEEANVETVLEKLGSPAEFAKKYSGQEQHLIGAEYYEPYCLVLKIVLLCTAISAIISIIVNTAVNPSDAEHILDIGIDTIIEGINSLVTAVGSVTIVFAIMEREKIKLETKKIENTATFTKGGKENHKKWEPKDLPTVPHKKGMIKRSDTVVKMIFIAIFSGILLFAPQVFGAWIAKEEQIHIIPLFYFKYWSVTLPLLLISMGIGFLDEIIRLIVGRYGVIVSISQIVTGIIQAVLTVVILKVFPMWNPNFIKEIEAVREIPADFYQELVTFWEKGIFTNVLLTIIIMSIIIDIIETLYKSIRYGEMSIET